MKGEHLSCQIQDPAGGATVRAIGFFMADKAPSPGDTVDVAFVPEWNEYRGRKSLQLRLKALRIQEHP